MRLGELNNTTRAIPLHNDAKGQHVTVLQDTPNHDHSRILRETLINNDIPS